MFPQAIRKYREFVTDGMMSMSPWSDLKKQIYLGNDAFINEMLNKIDPQMNLIDIPKTQYEMERHSLKEMDKKPVQEMKGFKSRTKAVNLV